MDERCYWIWLSRIEGLGPVKIKELLEIYKTPEQIWKLSKKELISVKGIGEKLADKILYEEYRKNLSKYINYMNKYGIGIITIQDEKYPEKLKYMYDSPTTLYYKGNIKLLNKSNIIAMVGCRECSEYGKYVSTKFSY